jgi:hypothetical protein
MTESKIKGTINELQAQCYFLALGYNVSVPVCEDCKYDFIADIDLILNDIGVDLEYIEENDKEYPTDEYIKKQMTDEELKALKQSKKTKKMGFNGHMDVTKQGIIEQEFE